jgi:hypothetical protein
MTDAQPDTEKARKERSPSFPFISLKRAVERLKEMADNHRRGQPRMVTVGTTWGYGPKSSGLLQTTAALKAFGLIDDLGSGPDRKIQVSDLGWRILQDERPGAREAAIREAALKPRLIAEYMTQWVPDRPSDSHCLSELQLDRGFNDVAATLFLKVFDETIAYANLKDTDKVSPNLFRDEDVIYSPAVELKPRVAPEAVQATVPGVSATASTGVTPFQITLGPDRISGAFNLTRQDEADEVIRMLTAMKGFLKPKEESTK